MTDYDSKQRKAQQWKESIGELLVKNLLVENAVNTAIGHILDLDYHSAGLVLQSISSYAVRIDLLKDLVGSADHLNKEEEAEFSKLLGRAKEINQKRNLVAHSMADHILEGDEVLIDKKKYKPTSPFSAIEVVKIEEIKELASDSDQLVLKIQGDVWELFSRQRIQEWEEQRNAELEGEFDS